MERDSSWRDLEQTHLDTSRTSLFVREQQQSADISNKDFRRVTDLLLARCQNTLSFPLRYPELFRESGLEVLRNDEFSKLGRPPSTREIATAMVRDQQLVQEMMIGHIFHSNDMPYAVSSSDFSYGIDMVRLPLALGEALLNGTLNDELNQEAQVTHTEGTINQDVRLLDLAVKARTFLQDHKGLSGYSLVEHVTDSYNPESDKEPMIPLFPSYRNPHFVYLGAQLAERYYKVSYEEAQKLGY